MGVVEPWCVDQVNAPSVFVDERVDLDFGGTWTCECMPTPLLLVILQDVNSWPMRTGPSERREIKVLFPDPVTPISAMTMSSFLRLLIWAIPASVMVRESIDLLVSLAEFRGKLVTFRPIVWLQLTMGGSFAAGR